MKKIFTLVLVVLLALSLAACSIFNIINAPPTLQEGERYFEGEVEFEYAENCTVSFVLTADGQNVRSAKVTMTNVEFEAPYNNRTISYSAGLVTYTGGKSIESDENGCIQYESRHFVLRITVDDDGAHGEMDYTHMSKPNEKAANRFSVFIGTFPFTAEDRTDSLNDRSTI